jgi:hypothetical protein
MKKVYGSAFERVRVSAPSGFLEHEHEPGWGPMFRLTIGKTYEVQVFKVKGPVHVDQVPYDQRSPTEALFYSQAQRALGERDSLDRRRVLKASLALWTDGLGLRVFEPEQLEAGAWYQVSLREVPTS